MILSNIKLNLKDFLNFDLKLAKIELSHLNRTM